MDKFDVIIAGAGPAGMMAAICAGQAKKRVLLVERNVALGKKLLISGKGRCNLTNSCEIEGFLEKFSKTRNFLRNAFARFFNSELISFFEDSGLKLKTERGGRVFPKSDKSADILNVLKLKLKNKNIKVLSGERVNNIQIKNNKIQGVLTYSGKRFLARHVAIATGGLSYPLTGSTGDGYKIAKACGHKVVVLEPALIPVRIKEKFIKEWQGISLRNVRLTLFSGDKKMDERFGEMLFTHFGISGPVVLDMSASIHDALKLKNRTTISINFKPALDHKKLNARLLREFNANHKKSIKNILKTLLPQGIISKFIEYCSIKEDKIVCQITLDERRRLIKGLFGLKLSIDSVMPIKYGIVTRGGVNIKEINPKTMESKLVKGLFFAGEILDVDAKTGGYNLQAAFSTGWVCGSNI